MLQFLEEHIRFYSSENVKELKNYGVIAALPSTVSMHDELILENRDIENSRNYFQYDDETIFLKEKRINGYKYIVFFSFRLTVDQNFFSAGWHHSVYENDKH
ncbi:MAG: hypothetical protein ACP5UZ_09190, partial [Thermoplasmata archaeon]